ncbi:FAD-dependent monooxygenase [Streptomyces sp. NPDC051921]|uniref:FAD-dependent oxidoreductase n=1 Tax=Streptomyces sp. NPDC051921 TaxID=3155806 RepID=UPI00343EFF6D
MTRVLILGGGLAGMLSAAALAPHVDEITIVEQDRLPDRPEARRGLPQAAHNHMLLGGGAEAVERLLPGTLDRLYAAGAHRRSYLDSILIRTTEGWGRRHEIDAYVIACSRNLVDHVVRQQVLQEGKVKTVEAAAVTGLTGTAARVTGARFETGDGRTETVEADLVVDATGHRSKTPDWLVDLGLPRVEEEFVDPGFAYSRQIYEAPEGLREDFPGVLIQPEHGTGKPGVGAALMPNEDGRWMVVMIGTRGSRPPTDQEGFLAFARGERTRVVSELIAGARPISPVRAYNDLANRRRNYHKLPAPEGFIVIGDAATRVNPTYATGMSAAALSALVLRDHAARGELTGAASRKVQAGIAKATSGPWQMALSMDFWFPEVKTNVKPPGGERMMRFANRYAGVSTDKQPVGNAAFKVSALMAPASSLMRLPLLLSVWRGSPLPPLTADQALSQYPQFVRALDEVPAVGTDDALFEGTEGEDRTEGEGRTVGEDRTVGTEKH